MYVRSVTKKKLNIIHFSFVFTGLYDILSLPKQAQTILVSLVVVFFFVVTGFGYWTFYLHYYLIHKQLYTLALNGMSWCGAQAKLFNLTPNNKQF